MPVDRKIYKVPFHKGNPSQWECPTCNKGILKGKEGSFSYKESKSSLDAHKHDAWEPGWITYVYSCQFICTNPACEDTIVSVGTGSVDCDPEFDSHGEPNSIQYFDYFKPSFFIPHLNIFKIAKNTPEEIKSSIEKSFELFFTNPSSSSNHLRIALEKTLDFLKIKKFETKNGKRILINTHRRINLLPKKLSNFRDLFFAIKWLGNNGSHSDIITIDDVMDAYDIFENILDELFDNRTEKTKKIAKQINKNKGHQNKK
ncbi:MAG: DUF4145 domain-containing protein [Patescibacteria group bacterium]